MVCLGFHEIQLRVNGVPLNEYDDDDDEPEQKISNHTQYTSKYVEAPPGQFFTIFHRVRPGYDFNCDYLSYETRIDGAPVSGAVVLKERYRGDIGHIDERDGYRTGSGNAWKIHKYKFADLQISEGIPGDRLDRTKEKYDKLGTIIITVRRKIQSYRSIEGVVDFGERFANGIPEKALKGRALSMRADASVTEPTTAPTIYHGMELDAYPIAQFKFKYRTRADLQSLLIIERSPTPVPLEDRDENTLTPEEMRELLRRHRARDAAARQVKIEGQRNPKREREETITPTRAYKMSRTSDGKECIDLDSDSENPVQEIKPEKKKTAAVETVDLVDV